jgi:hypothetical protein
MLRLWVMRSVKGKGLFRKTAERWKAEDLRSWIPPPGFL